MDIRYAANPRDVKRYTTEELRKEFLIENLYQPDSVTAVYSHVDRMVTLGCMPVEEKVSVYGDEARIKLLALIGSNKDELPQEAAVTRLVHVTFHPEDAYGSEEKMDIAIYGDFVYCTLSPAEGGTVTYRADCSLRELDSFLTACAATPAPSAAPTPDPYVAPSPAPAETPVETPAETSDAQ